MPDAPALLIVDDEPRILSALRRALRREGYEIVTAEITTRDIDRGNFPHFLLKEISDAQSSFSKTLRGKLLEADDGSFTVSLGGSTGGCRRGSRGTAIRSFSSPSRRSPSTCSPTSAPW